MRGCSNICTERCPTLLAQKLQEIVNRAGYKNFMGNYNAHGQEMKVTLQDIVIKDHNKKLCLLINIAIPGIVMQLGLFSKYYQNSRILFWE